MSSSGLTYIPFTVTVATKIVPALNRNIYWYYQDGNRPQSPSLSFSIDPKALRDKETLTQDIQLSVRLWDDSLGWRTSKKEKKKQHMNNKIHIEFYSSRGEEGLPWLLSWERLHLQCRRYQFDPWVGKIHWREVMATHSSILAWRIPTEKRSLAGYSPWGHKESDITEWLNTHTHIYRGEEN